MKILGLLLDAAGTLLSPAASVATTYCDAAQAFGCTRTVQQVREAFAPAMERTKALRDGDPTWRHYWRAVIREATGVDSEALTEQLYAHYTEPRAWTFAPGAVALLRACMERRVPVAVVSNWDTRLRGLLTRMCVAADLEVPEIVVSAEEGIEKPAPEIFLRACARLGVEPHATLMVGDSELHDIEGARAAGCHAWLLGERDAEDLTRVATRLFGSPRP